MARMPQIPGVDYTSRPDGQVPQGGEILPSDGGAKALETGANFVESIADAQQRQLDQITAAKQKIVDTTTATRSAGDFEEKLRSQMTSLQSQFVDAPEKLPDEFLKSSRQLADDTIKAAPNSQVGLKLAEKTSSTIDSMMTAAHSWAQGRMTQKAKSDLTVMTNQATRGAEDVPNPVQLNAYAASKHKDLDPLFQSLTGDAQKAKEHLDSEIAKSWVTAASARDPINTLKALDAKSGFLVDNLTAEDRKSLRAQAVSSFEGMGKTKQVNVLKEGIDQTGKAYDLFRTNELTAGTVYSMRKANDAKALAISLDPNMDDKSRAAQLKTIDMQNETLRQLDIANRKQSGFDATPDEDVRGKLVEQHDALFKQDDGKAGQNLADVVKFRHDLAQAYSDNKISRNDLDRMDKSVALAMPKAMSKESTRTGLHIPVLDWTWRNPREAGNVVLNDLMDEKTGMFGTLTPAQKNNARLYYIEQMNDAMDNGRPLDTEKFARAAAYHVAGKRLPK